MVILKSSVSIRRIGFTYTLNQTLVTSRIHEKTTKKYSLFFKKEFKIFPAGLVLYNHDQAHSE